MAEAENDLCTQVLAYTLTDCLLPSSLVERPSFQKLLEMVSRGAYRLPHRTFMIKMQERQHEELKKKV
jgi:hypothetical protein